MHQVPIKVRFSMYNGVEPPADTLAKSSSLPLSTIQNTNPSPNSGPLDPHFFMQVLPSRRNCDLLGPKR